jgi:prophage regulatory protein
MSANDLEKLTGIKASTFRYWAVCTPPQGPPSFHLGRHRRWRRSTALAWIAEQESKAAAK